MEHTQEAVRRLTVGPDYKTGMHYIVGNEVMGGKAIISDIVKNKNGYWEVWIKNPVEGIMKWKSFENVPVHIEHDCEF